MFSLVILIIRSTCSSCLDWFYISLNKTSGNDGNRKTQDCVSSCLFCIQISVNHPKGRFTHTSALIELFALIFFHQVLKPRQMTGHQITSHETIELASWLPSGGYSTLAPPGPIPNPEVKRRCADGSVAIGHARVGRRQNLIVPVSEQGDGDFFLP